ncbi:MAG: glycosyltransferase [Acidobacteria bacterium]|nr:glycosyltransferase [Acidobacteriota bacterium]MCA1649540.1 glycosyltransferase [Acidobacteriota bacterium]
MPASRRPVIWLLQDGEPLPTDADPRLMRTGHHAEHLVRSGFSVTWWTSRFNHNRKEFRQAPGTLVSMGPDYRIALLDGPGYSRNMSLARVRHYRAIAAHFTKLAQEQPRPALIVGSYPSPELCDAGRSFARRLGVPFIVDIRDPWPDIYPEYLPAALRWTLLPLLRYHRQKIGAIARDAAGIIAVSTAMLDWGVRYARRPRGPHDRVFHIGFRKQPIDREIHVPQAFSPEAPLTCLFATTCGRSYDGKVLVDAARLLEARGERRVRFIVSGDGDQRARWMRRGRGLTSITFTGWIPHDELQRHFMTSHVGLVLMTGGITRFWLGNKIFEYLSAFLAVVNNVPGESADIVASRGVGTNTPPGDAAALAAALVNLADRPDLVRAQMQSAKRVFLSEFERDAVTAQYLQHLQVLMEPPPLAEAAGI